MNHGSLFSGIGGFDLAAEWMGWNNVFNCEWEEFPRQVLKHHFPNAIQHGDIKELDATTYFGRIDILTGGFPCQPYSFAGQRKGKDDERHLWDEMLRVIQECAPRYVVGENVLGLVGWNGGMVFEEVCSDLEAEGYAVQPYVLPAASVGAPHRRNRVWFVAYADGCDENTRRKSNIKKKAEIRRHETSHVPGALFGDGTTTNATSTGTQKHNWENFPTISAICGGDDGLPTQLDGITFSKWRRETIKAYGNAIVPQVALQIFKAIEQYELSL